MPHANKWRGGIRPESTLLVYGGRIYNGPDLPLKHLLPPPFYGAVFSMPVRYHVRMKSNGVSGGVVHKVPADLHRALTTHKKVLPLWESLTPLARNEWICWIISVKKTETREEHIERLLTELPEGKRRPCCWIGCIHRTDKKLSPSIRGILTRKKKKTR